MAARPGAATGSDHVPVEVGIAPFTERPSDQQTTALVRLLVPEQQDFSFLIAERSDEMEWSVGHVWTETWLLRLHEWREEQSMLIAGPRGTRQRVAAADLSSWGVGPTTAWPPGCQGDHDRHFGLEPRAEA